MGKVRDGVGALSGAADRAFVTCLGEKSPILTLSRTRLGLRLTFGKSTPHAHTCQRHGSTSRFVALNVANHRIIGQLKDHHHGVEFLQVLTVINTAGPAGQDVHLIMDNYGIHKTQKVRA